MLRPVACEAKRNGLLENEAIFTMGPNAIIIILFHISQFYDLDFEKLYILVISWTAGKYKDTQFFIVHF